MWRAYADLGLLDLIYLQCSLNLVIIYLEVCPIYLRLQVWQRISYTPLLSKVFCGMLHSLMCFFFKVYCLYKCVVAGLSDILCILCLVLFFLRNCAVYEIMSKNVVQPDRTQMATWRLVACWISKATCAQAHASACAPTPTPLLHTHTHKYVRYCFSTATTVSWTLLSVTLCVHCLSCCNFSVPKTSKYSQLLSS